MVVEFTPEQEAQLLQVAASVGTPAVELVRDAALRLVQEDSRFCSAVQEGVRQADQGEFVEEAEMDVRLEQMLRT